MTIEEIQDAFRFDMDMILFDPFSGESESEELYLERNKRNGNEMNIVCYLAKKEAIDLLEELKLYKNLNLEIPQHFTKEQSAWIKKYCIEKNKEFYNKAIDDVLETTKEYKNHFIEDNLYKEFFDEVERLKAGESNE